MNDIDLSSHKADNSDSFTQLPLTCCQQLHQPKWCKEWNWRGVTSLLANTTATLVVLVFRLFLSSRLAFLKFLSPNSFADLRPPAANQGRLCHDVWLCLRPSNKLSHYLLCLSSCCSMSPGLNLRWENCLFFVLRYYNIYILFIVKPFHSFIIHFCMTISHFLMQKI